MRVSLIGTGLMGEPMAARLLETGHRVTVYNRSPGKTTRLVEAGAARAASPAEAIASSDVTVLMLSDAAAIRSALAAAGDLPDLGGRTLLQMATIGITESLDLQRDVLAAGGEYVEAPVLGSRTQAAEGTLLIVVGSEVAQFERWAPLLGCLGADPRHVGPVGSAAAIKLAFNQLIASHVSAFSLSLGLVRRSGADIEEFMTVLRRSGIHAKTYDAKMPRMLERDFSDANFHTRLLLKDVDLVAAEARRLGLDTTAIDGIRELVDTAVRHGLAEKDYSAVYEAVDPDDDP